MVFRAERKMPRLTRTESQALTRQKLLATAKACFLRDGYAATSLEGIAEAAGFSKGAVYSNFKSKDELCLAVLDAVRTDRAAELAAAVAGKETLPELLKAFETWAERHIGDRAWTSLEVEFALHASRDRALGKQLAVREKAVRVGVVKLVGALVKEHGLVLPLPAEDVAIGLLSLGIGLGVQRAIDPKLSVRSLAKVTRLLALGGG
jgi:AcrR family transcriptional regulator